jgi:VCBS repeat protein/dockerin type I repeat protein
MKTVAVLLTALFLLPVEGRPADCNHNGIDDSEDLSTGSSQDCNHNRVPDECDLAERVRFAGPPAFLFEGGVSAISSGEVDGDGRADLLVMHQELTGTILRQEADRTFRLELLSGVEGNMGLLVDLDGDGRSDLVASHNQLSVFLNDGRGSFAPAGVQAVQRDPLSLTSGDLDGDGRQDILFASWQAEAISVFRNADAGRLDAERLVPAGEIVYGLDLADLDGDGDLDVAAATTTPSGGSLAILLNDGAGGLALSHPAVSGTGFVHVAAADFDRDGRLDLAGRPYSLNQVQVHRNLGPAGFTRLATVNAIDAPIMSFAAIDLDGDHAAEIALSYFAERGIAVLGNDGHGKLSPLGPEINSPIRARSMLPVDVDGDGRPDLVTADDERVMIFWNDLGRLGSVRQVPLDRDVVGMVAADFPGGAGPRVVVALNESRRIMAFGRRKPRDLSLIQTVTLARPTGDMYLADLNADGTPDLALTSTDESAAQVIIYDLGAGLRPLRTIPVAPRAFAISAADYDLDGAMDLAVGNFNSADLTILWGRANLEFDTMDVPSRSEVYAIASADFDGDGVPDLALADEVQSRFSVSVILSAGGRSWTPPRAAASALNSPTHLKVADFDGDGDLDIAAPSRNEPSGINLLRNDGLGNLSELQTIAGPIAGDVVPLDFDADGAVDLAVAESSTVSILHNEGGGHLAPWLRFAGGSSPTSMAAVDLDVDGRPDLITADSGVGNEGRLTILDNITGPASADVDHDLVPDECEPDCNRNHLPDDLDLSSGTSLDCNANGIPDECDIATGNSDCNSNGIPDSCDIAGGHSQDLKGHGPDGIPDECQPTIFHRGDGNGDGTLDVSDAVCMIQYLFRGGGLGGGGGPLRCLEAADSNNDGAIDCSDAIFVFNYLFLGGEPPAPPGPLPAPCGPDSDPPGSKRDLGCEAYTHC